jgi:Ion transport protein
MAIEKDASWNNRQMVENVNEYKEQEQQQRLLRKTTKTWAVDNIGDDPHRRVSESNNNSSVKMGILRHPAPSWVPGGQEGRDRHVRSWRRCIFLLLTEPESSTMSAIFYGLLMTTIFTVNTIMVMQTMDVYQYTPDDCVTCGGDIRYFFDVDDTVITNKNGFVSGVECVCPPEPLPYLGSLLKHLIDFFAIEWVLRIVCFVEKDPAPTLARRMFQWLGYVTSPTTLMDALAILPFYLEGLPNTFVSLRLLKSFQMFQLIRLGHYNTLFISLTNVMAKSLNYLRLLVLILAFGSALFGSLIYWVERGTWQYHEKSQKFLFVRIGADGVTEEPSPFRSIPEAFWWFMVTATTVGYGGERQSNISCVYIWPFL